MGRAVRDIADKLAKELNLPLRTGRKLIERFLQEVELDLVDTGRIELRGLGVFATQERPAHQTIHPKTREAILIPDYKTVRFRTSQALRRKLNPSENLIG